MEESVAAHAPEQVIGALASRGEIRPLAHGAEHAPEHDAAAVDEKLIDQMSLARQVASLGLSARNSR